MSTSLRFGVACLYACLFLIINSCQKDPCEGVSCQNGGACKDGKCQCPAGYTGTFCETQITGRIVFWTDKDPGCGQISITVNGTTKTISSFMASAPSCAAQGFATFTLPPGDYTYSASCGSKSWNGEITVEGNTCSAARVDVPTDPNPNPGPGTTTGRAIFWANQSLGCATVTVTIGSVQQSLSSFTSVAPACGTTGYATFTLVPGIYNYTASCASGNWSGSVTVTANGCATTRLDPVGSGGTTGNAVFWLNEDPKCGPVTVTIGGTTQQITKYVSSAPTCGTTGYATFTLPVGTHNYTASCTGTNWSGQVTVAANGCASKLLLPAAKGNAMFWVQEDIHCGDISVTINGTTRKITGYHSAGVPACGATAAANFELAPGSYNYTASCNGVNWSGSVNVVENGCATMKLNAPTTGQFMFWMNQDAKCGTVTVNVAGQSKTISSFYDSGDPTCGAAGSATFVLAPGTYSYTATCSNGSWNGSITVTASQCGRQRLDPAPSGQVMFWTQSQLNCGNVTVNIANKSGIINSFYSGGAPACGASGCATFQLAPGSYSFTASCSGKNWNGSVTVTKDGCSRFRLDP